MTTHALASVRECVPSFLQQTSLRLILFGGKGGVGKTTCAAAAALHLAGQSPEQAFLIVSIDPAHSLTDSFCGLPPAMNLGALECDARESLRKFKEAHAHHLRQIALRGTFLDDEDIGQLIDLSMPGLDEVMALSDLSVLVESRLYQCIIVDTAPTGHMLRFLELPELMQEWLRALDTMLGKHRYMSKLYRGSYRKDETDAFIQDMAASIQRVWSLLRDPVRCRFVPVMLAESLSVKETRRLLDRLEAMKIPITDVLVNRVHSNGEGCPACEDARRGQNVELRTIARQFRGLSLWELPLREVEVRGAEQLSAFWDGIRPLNAPPGEVCVLPPLPARARRPARLPDTGASLLLFAGKGGVGKTTLASATALRLAQCYPGKEVLLFSTDPAHSLSDCLCVSVGAREAPIRPGLTAMETDTEAEFEKLKKQYADDVARLFASLTGRGTIDLAFDREVIERIMDLSPPGLDEVMALTKAMELLESGKYDILVLDTAPSGHLIRLLELPGLIQEWLKVFFGLFLKYRNVLRLPGISDFMVAMSKRLKNLRTVLSDRRKGQLYAVSILTEMAFEESRDLLAACRRMGIHVPALFLNLATFPSECRLCTALALAESKVSRKFKQTFGGIRQCTVYRCGEPRGADRLSELGQAIYRD